MSNRALTAARLIKAGGPSNKAVLNCLADHANDRGQAWPSISTIHDETELSERTVKRSLVDLQKRKLIARRDRFVGKVRFNLYVLDWCHGDTTQGQADTDQCQDDTQCGDTVSPDRCHSDPQSYIEATNEAPVSKGRRGTRLPLDWQPTDDNLAYAKERGLDGNDLRDEIELFRNYWHGKSGKEAVKLDWVRTWQSWVIRWKKFEERKRPSRPDNVAPFPKRSSYAVVGQKRHDDIERRRAAADTAS